MHFNELQASGGIKNYKSSSRRRKKKFLFKKNVKKGREMETKSTPFFHGPADPFRADQLQWLYRSNYKDVYCRVCEERLHKRIYHKHHSSLFFSPNLCQVIWAPGKLPYTCKVPHPALPENGDRTVVLNTTSTLHNVFLNPSVRLPFHIDVESICGGKIVDLFKGSGRIILSYS